MGIDRSPCEPSSNAGQAREAEPPDPRPVLSVVLPVWNGAATLQGQLDALAGQRCPVAWEVVVVDNDSTDDTAAMVTRHRVHHPEVRLVRAPDAHNLSYVRNAGVRAAHGSLLAFCDDDDLVGPRWVAAMADALATHPLVASAMEYERLNPPHALVGRARFQSTQIEMFLGRPVCNGAIGVRRDVWEQIGGNDETMSFTGEDFEFALRCGRDLGIEPVLVADAVYHYRLRTGGRATFRQARAYGRAHAALRQRFALIGPSEPRPHAQRELWWLASRAPFAALGHHRALWAWRAGTRVGRSEHARRADRRLA